MNPRTEAWVNVILSSAAIGLASYQAALSTGANTKSAALTGAIGFLGALQGHFRQSPADVLPGSLATPNDATGIVQTVTKP